MLRMRNVCKIYRADVVETHALRDCSIDVAAGELVAVTGPSGSGKTTFLNIAGLLELFDSGTYELAGVDTSRLSDAARSRLRNEKLGFVFQSFNLITNLDIYDNVEVPLRYRGMSHAERHKRVMGALELVGLSARMKHLPAQLSGGQQQRAAIARAIVGEPALLLADEPTGNLDSVMARQIMDLLGEINRAGTTIVMVTHDAELAHRCHRSVHIVDGQVGSVKAEPRAQPAPSPNPSVA